MQEIIRKEDVHYVIEKGIMLTCNMGNVSEWNTQNFACVP